MFEIVHNVDKAVGALLKAPLDLEIEEEHYGRQVAKQNALAEHRALYEAYASEFRTVLDEAMNWWEAVLDTHLEDEDVTREEAVDMAYDDYIAGPAQAPEVVSHVRRYWLACDGLNKSVASDQRIAPACLLLAWLIEDEQKLYVRLLSCMPYWPIGLDENGNWC